MRDLLVFLVFIVILPQCYLRPWVGLMSFSFLAYNRTQDLTWGFARSLPISQFIALATLAGWATIEPRPLSVKDPRNRVQWLLWLVIGVSIFLNEVRWDVQWNRYVELGKVILMAQLTAALIVNRERLRQMMAVIAVALGFFGLKNGLLFCLGSRTIIGPGGMMKDNNDFALALVMNIPVLWYMAPEFGKNFKNGRLWYLGCRVVTFFTVLAIASTGSRGGALSLAVTAFMMSMKTRFKVPAMVGVVVLGFLGLTFAPAEYKERLSTISFDVSKMDESAKGRIMSWMVATNMIKDNPVLGIGQNNMVFEYPKYTHGVYTDPDVKVKKVVHRVAHNSYFQIWAESGTIAYALWMFMILSTILFMRRLESQAKKTADEWVLNYTRTIECMFYGFLVGATFLNRAHFDLIYQVIATGTALPLVIRAERERRRRESNRGPVTRANEAWVRHRDPFVKVPT